MKNRMLKLKENGKGNFDINNLGPDISGKNGDIPFDLLIQSNDLSINVLLRDVYIRDMFERLDPKKREYSAGRYHVTDYIKVTHGSSPTLMVRENLFQFIQNAVRDSSIISNGSSLILFMCKRSKKVQAVFKTNTDKKVV